MFADIGTAVVEMRLKSLFAISLVVIVLLSNAAGQGYVDILPDEVKNPFYARQDIIVKELSKPQASEWVGRYYREPSPTWGEVIVWEPRTGFAAYRDTCSNGPRAWVNYGTVSFDNGVLAITPERDTNSEHVLNFPFRQFTTVKWGQQHWLVPTEELALFADTRRECQRYLLELLGLTLCCGTTLVLRRIEAIALLLDSLEVAGRRFVSEAVRQQIVPGITRLHLHHVAWFAEVFDRLAEDDFHV